MKNLIGNTPLVQISDKIYAKLETYNPSGSIKDRMAYFILTEAIKRGQLKKGDTIVEATSGNTGIAIRLSSYHYYASQHERGKKVPDANLRGSNH